MIKIKNLNVSIDNKEILKDINLNLEKGKVYALMGRNGSGKSTLANVLMGNPKYTVTSGEIIFEEENITKIFSNERAKRGIFMSFQTPTEVSGVTIFDFLRSAYNAVNEKKLSLLEFQKFLEKKAAELKIEKKFLERYLNEGFSGGEKKKSEILQLLALNPKFAILDETDSGLDIDSLKIVAEGVNKFINENKTVLIITHYKRIFDHISPDKVFIMKEGKIIKEGEKSLIEEIENKGFENVS